MQEIATIHGRMSGATPEWALLQRHLLKTMSDAALYFGEHYTHPDGSLIWGRDAWQGMDGSDDAYESIYNFPLLYALGGDEHLLPLAHHVWEGITRQFSTYGQIYREFDAYYDWMHHGESSLFLYYLSLAGRYGEIETQRAMRFAGLYTGEDVEAPNYDADRRMIRSPLNGSRGPRLATSTDDWTELRGIYSQYPAPFTDITGIKAAIADWTDAIAFEQLLERFNAHIARGDVPLNLMATSLVTHGFMLTGNEQYRQWVLDYLAAWVERTTQNGGVTPDNIGLSGRIGEYNDGKWYGGYYGWGWPHGGRTLLEALAVAGMNATLLSGNLTYPDLFRTQFDWLWRQGREVDGVRHTPWWRDDNGWRDYRRMDARLPIAVWNLTQLEQDRERVDRFPDHDHWDEVHDIGWGDEANVTAWYQYVSGHGSDFPVQVLRAAYKHMSRRMELIRNDSPNPKQWPSKNPFENDVHLWLNRNPVSCEGLVQTMWGAPMPIYHGGLLHAQVRYFDEETQRSGLPADVAALVEKVGAKGIVLHALNLNPVHGRSLLVQAGSFREHTFGKLTRLDDGLITDVNAKYVRIQLAPGAGWRGRIDIGRLTHTPAYTAPFG